MLFANENEHRNTTVEWEYISKCKCCPNPNCRADYNRLYYTSVLKSSNEVGFTIVCNNCGVHGPVSSNNILEAVDLWNSMTRKIRFVNGKPIKKGTYILMEHINKKDWSQEFYMDGRPEIVKLSEDDIRRIHSSPATAGRYTDEWWADYIGPMEDLVVELPS